MLFPSVVYALAICGGFSHLVSSGFHGEIGNLFKPMRKPKNPDEHGHRDESKNAVTRKAGIISPPNFSVSPVRNRTIGQSFLILYFSNRLVSLSKADGQHAFWAFSASLRHFYSSERAPEPDAHSVLHPSAFFVSLHTIPYAKPDSRNE